MDINSLLFHERYTHKMETSNQENTTKDKNNRNKSLLYTLIVLLALAIISWIIFQEKSERLPKLSAEQEEKAFATAQTFATCASNMEASAWIAEQINKTEMAQNLNNSRNGWQLAGAYLLYSLDVIDDFKKASAYTKGISDAQTQRYKGMIEMNPEDGMNTLNKEFSEKCAPLVEFQESLVMELRETAAKIKENK